MVQEPRVSASEVRSMLADALEGAAQRLRSGEQAAIPREDTPVTTATVAAQTEGKLTLTVDEAAQRGVLDPGNGMGVSFGDYNNDGLLDAHASNMSSTAGNRILPSLPIMTVDACSLARQDCSASPSRGCSSRHRPWPRRNGRGSRWSSGR